MPTQSCIACLLVLSVCEETTTEFRQVPTRSGLITHALSQPARVPLFISCRCFILSAPTLRNKCIPTIDRAESLASVMQPFLAVLSCLNSRIMGAIHGNVSSGDGQSETLVYQEARGMAIGHGICVYPAPYYVYKPAVAVLRLLVVCRPCSRHSIACSARPFLWSWCLC